MVLERHGVVAVGVSELAQVVCVVVLVVVEGPQVNAVREVVREHASAVAGAVVGARHAGAALPFVPLEAHALLLLLVVVVGRGGSGLLLLWSSSSMFFFANVFVAQVFCTAAGVDVWRTTSE